MLDNHPDEVDSKAVLAYGLVNKATNLSTLGSVLLQVMNEFAVVRFHEFLLLYIITYITQQLTVVQTQQ